LRTGEHDAAAVERDPAPGKSYVLPLIVHGVPFAVAMSDPAPLPLTRLLLRRDTILNFRDDETDDLVGGYF